MGVAPAKFNHNTATNIVTRIITALVGGYVLANLGAIAFSLLLPGSKAGAVLAGMQLSFIFYAGVVIWTFSVNAVRQAWVGVLVGCFVCIVTIGILKGLA